MRWRWGDPTETPSRLMRVTRFVRGCRRNADTPGFPRARLRRGPRDDRRVGRRDVHRIGQGVIPIAKRLPNVVGGCGASPRPPGDATIRARPRRGPRACAPDVGQRGRVACDGVGFIPRRPPRRGCALVHSPAGVGETSTPTTMEGRRLRRCARGDGRPNDRSRAKRPAPGSFMMMSIDLAAQSTGSSSFSRCCIWLLRRARMEECIWLTRDSERSSVAPISFMVMPS